MIHLTDHVTDGQLNEYLDHESPERAQIESHLAECSECAARLAALQTLFAEIESLPELELSHNIGARLITTRNLPAKLPPPLTLAVTLQAVAALIVLIVAAPFIANLMPAIPTPSLTEIFVRWQNHWNTWFDWLVTFRFPTMPQIPTLEVSSLMFTLTLVGVSMLWVLGNGLLLRKQMK